MTMSETCIVCLGDLTAAASVAAGPLASSPSDAAEDQRDAVEGDIERYASDSSDPPPFQYLPSDNEMIAHLLPCGHNLHDECLKPWVERANSCPICRQNFNTVELLTQVGGPIVSSYAVSDRTQVADIDPSMLIEEFDDTEESTPCPKCGRDDNEDLLLLCDGCDGAFHTYCVGLDCVPVGHWFCEDCTITRALDSAAENLRSVRLHPNDRRTRGQQRRTRNRNQAVSSSWARVWQTVWDRLNIDLDFPFDDNRGAASRYRGRDCDERNGGTSISQQRQGYRAWERRLQIAERQGGSSRFRDTATALLDRPTVSRPRPEPPEPESVEEILAWNALEKARDIQADPAPKSSRKRKSATSSPAEPESNPRKRRRKESATSSASEQRPTPAPQAERRLKRPQTRRAHDLKDISTGGAAEGVSASRQGSITAVRGASSPDAVASGSNAPSFLQSLLKEVESSAVPDEPRNGGPTINNVALDHASPYNSSPGASPTASNHPSPGRAMSTTPPPSMSARSLSPVPLTSKVEPIYPPAPDLFSLSSSDNTNTTPSERKIHPHRTSKSQTRVGRWALQTAAAAHQHQSSSSPPPYHRQYSRSEETSPTRANMSLSTKENLQKLVKDALKVPYLNKQVTKDQYTEINRNVSRMLYDRVGEEADSKANGHGNGNPNGDVIAADVENWKRMAKEEVERAVSSLQGTATNMDQGN